jgi:hypothetical protein
VIFGFAPLTLALVILAVLIVVSAVIVVVGIRVANRHERDAVDFRDVMLGRMTNARGRRYAFRYVAARPVSRSARSGDEPVACRGAVESRARVPG